MAKLTLVSILTSKYVGRGRDASNISTKELIVSMHSHRDTSYTEDTRIGLERTFCLGLRHPIKACSLDDANMPLPKRCNASHGVPRITVRCGSG